MAFSPARAFALVAALGCGNALDAPGLTTREGLLIGGTLEESAELNHTGALVALDPTAPEPVWFCTATLIAPETVVTAKHCVPDIFEAESRGWEVAWLTGPSVADAAELIPVVAVERTPRARDGFLRMGRDVAVAHLEHATSIPPATPMPLSDQDVGRALLTIGYGVFGAQGEEDGQRRSGSTTVTAVRGSVLAAMFGDFESYVEWRETNDVTDFDYLQMFSADDPLDQFVLAGLRDQFESRLLLDGYEAVAGRAPGDVQTCVGDSGGPLLRPPAEDGRWQTVGVVSGSSDSKRSVCDFGSVFATFGPETLAFLAQAQGWSDPCGDVPASGECRGSVAVRCETSLFAARRELVSRDCAESERECFLGTDGVDCHEPTLGSRDAGSSNTGSDAGSSDTASDAGTLPSDTPPVESDAGAGGAAEDAGSVAAEDAGAVVEAPALD